MKGWDVYRYLDEQLGTKDFGSRFEFHYIGNLPKRCVSKIYASIHPRRVLSWCSLTSCDIYLTLPCLNLDVPYRRALCGLPISTETAVVSWILSKLCVAFHDKEDTFFRNTRLRHDTRKPCPLTIKQVRKCAEYNASEQLLEKRAPINQQLKINHFSFKNEMRLNAKMKWYYLLAKREATQR